MNTLIIKLGAAGDVVRTTSLLRRFDGLVTWMTASQNKPLLSDLEQIPSELRVVEWDERSTIAGKQFDLVINLEDDAEVSRFLRCIRTTRLFGAFEHTEQGMSYTTESSAWFDMSLISVYGREKADQLKLQNRRSYQELIFSGLGMQFFGDHYLLPTNTPAGLTGDVAIASEAGPVWPMKKWAEYAWLKNELEHRGLTVNYLPTRLTLFEHLADIRGHRCLVSGDSLPMHLALGSRIPCVALFNCTSPWEIYDYGILKKLISPLLDEFFYKRGFDARATTAISREAVLSTVLENIDSKVTV